MVVASLLIGAAALGCLRLLIRLQSRQPIESANAVLVGLADCYHSSTYDATGGGRLRNYVDADDLLARPLPTMEAVADWLTEQLRRFPDERICFLDKDAGPVGPVACAWLLAMRLQRSVSILRVHKDMLWMSFKGARLGQGDRVVLVDDVVRTGLHVVKAQKRLASVGARVVAVVAFVDRRSEVKLDPELDPKIEIVAACAVPKLLEHVDQTRSGKPAYDA